MNILILNSSSDLYGGCKIMSIVAGTLAGAGHRPIVVLSGPGPLVDYLRERNIEVRIIRLGILRRKYLNPKGILNRIRVSRTAWKALGRLIREENIQLVYSNTTSVLIGAPLARKHKLRHLWHVHEIITRPLWFSKAMGLLLKRYGDQVIGVSEAVKTHWEKYMQPKKVTRIYNGIDVQPYLSAQSTLKASLGLSPDTLLVGMIGRVNHWKGQHYFVQIAQLLQKELPDCHFVLAGDAYPGNEHLEQALEQAIQDSGISGNIHQLGYREDVPQLLQGLDLLVSPSILPDPFPTVILEAMASGKMVAATAHGGATEMIEDGVSGVLIPPADAAEAARRILPYLQQSERRERAGEEARKRILALYSLERFQKNILELFNRLNPERP